MTLEVTPIEETQQVAELQQEEQVTAEEELAEVLQEAAVHTEQNRRLELSKETVLRILELFSQRERLTDEERNLIRDMITDLSDDLKGSKKAQAGIYLACSLVGGATGAIGSAWWKGASSLGDMIHGFGPVSDHFHSADQVWMEVGKQLRMNDMGQNDALDQKIHKGMERVMDAVATVENTRHTASRTR